MNRYADLMRQLCSIPSWAGSAAPIHLSEEDLLAAEARLGSTLPADFREFIRDFGGFILPAARFPMPSAGVKRAASIEGFDWILPKNTRASDLITRYERFCNIHDVWPRNCVPIGDNAGSGVIGLSFKGEDKGAVYMMIEHATVYFVASSFDEFMHLLYNYENEPEMKEDAELFWKPYMGEE